MQSRKLRRQTRRPRYRVIGGVPSIELKLRSPRQLFDERDPAPFRERDLDDDAVRYIVSSFRELKDQQDVKVQLYFESLGEFENNPTDIARALHSFFRYEADMRRKDLRTIFHHGIVSLAVGLLFLFLCTWFAYGLESTHPRFWESLVHEGLFITGWVSMWKPISIFLHDWWPIEEDVRTLSRLAEVDVEVAPLKPSVVMPVSNTTVTPGAAPTSTSGKKDFALA